MFSERANASRGLQPPYLLPAPSVSYLHRTGLPARCQADPDSLGHITGQEIVVGPARHLAAEDGRDVTHPFLALLKGCRARRTGLRCRHATLRPPGSRTMLSQAGPRGRTSPGSTETAGVADRSPSTGGMPPDDVGLAHPRLPEDDDAARIAHRAQRVQARAHRGAPCSVQVAEEPVVVEVDAASREHQ